MARYNIQIADLEPNQFFEKGVRSITMKQCCREALAYKYNLKTSLVQTPTTQQVSYHPNSFCLFCFFSQTENCTAKTTIPTNHLAISLKYSEHDFFGHIVQP